MSLYLLHASEPVGPAGGRQARHYLGWTNDAPGAVERRVREHASGESDAALPRALVAIGAELQLVRVWPGGTRVDERHLKRAGHFDQHCYLCLRAEAELLETELLLWKSDQVSLPDNTPSNSPQPERFRKLKRPAGTPSHTGYVEETAGS